MSKNIYIAGPMTNRPYFNRASFDTAAKKWRDEGWFVFNPVEHDIEMHGEYLFDNPTGDPKVAIALGFNLREALNADLGFITERADALYMLTGWEKSNGARAEHATAVALGLEIYYE